MTGNIPGKNASTGTTGTSKHISIKKPKTKKSEALWMLTFADLSFILMCFFALLLSMSTLNTKKFDNIIEGFDATKRVKKTRSLEQIRKLVEREVRKRRLQYAVSVNLDADGLAIEFKSKLLFQSGSGSINPQHAKVTSSIFQIIAKAPKKYGISIEGHTDDVPLSGRGRYKNNWDLSSARAIAVLKDLSKRKISTKRMKVIALADTKPKIPITKQRGIHLKNARAKNRRVVIRIN